MSNPNSLSARLCKVRGQFHFEHQVLLVQPAPDPVGGRHHRLQQGSRVPRPQVLKEQTAQLRVIRDSHGQAASGAR
jgi:hypothetical protein